MPEELPADIVLKPDSYGWTAEIPAKRGCFLSHSILLELHTRSVPEDMVPPEPDDLEITLARKVLEGLETVLDDSASQFQTYTAAMDREAANHIRHPHIWICREFIEAGSRWAFVIERDDAPDFGYHIEFDGIHCLGISAGD
jgi:hypothetical protein